LGHSELLREDARWLKLLGAWRFLSSGGGRDHLQHFDYGLADAYPLRAHTQLLQGLSAQNGICKHKTTLTY